MASRSVSSSRRFRTPTPAGGLRPLSPSQIAEASPITVAIYDDRLEITSPGRLKRGVTVEKMLEGCSDCRNEALALALSYMNIIEDWGSGIPRIRQELKEAGLRDLVIQDWPNAVRSIIYRRSTAPVSVPVNTGSAPVNSHDGHRDSALVLLDVIRAHPGQRKTSLATMSGISQAMVKRLIEQDLKSKIEFRGAPKTGGYYVVDSAGLVSGF